MGIEQPQQIEHYKIGDLVEKTPYWVVFAAEDERTQQPVWLQRILPDLQCSQTFLSSFTERAGQLSFLDHPNLLKIMDQGVFEDSPYLVLESFPSHSFADFTANPQSIQQIAQVLQPAAEALIYLHQNDFVHGQITDQSIRINDDQIRLANYGFYDLLQDELRRQMPQEMLNFGTGDLDYLSPEQITGKEITLQSDIYALGVLLFVASTGTKPFPGSNSMQEVAQRLHCNPAWPKDVHSKLPTHAIRLLQKALLTDKKYRFQSMEEFAHELNNLTQNRRAKAPLPLAVRKKLPRSKQFKTTLRVFGIGAILAVFAIASFLLYQNVPAIQKLASKDTTTNTPATQIEPTAIQQATKTSEPTPFPTTPLFYPSPTIEATPSYVKEVQSQQLPIIMGQTAPQQIEVIQPENADQIQEISRLGMGKFGQVAWHPDNTKIALATSSGVYLFKPTDLSNPFFINTGDWADSVEFSPDGAFLAIGLHQGDVLLWDVYAETIQTTLTGHTGKVSDLIFSTNNRYLFSASFDRTVKMWNVYDGTEIKTIVAHSQPIRSIDVSRDGRFLVTGANDRLVKLWDVASSTSLKEFPIPASALSVAISPDSEYIASGGADGIIRQWSITSFQLRNEPIVNPTGVWSLQFDQHGTSLFYFSDYGKFYQTSVHGSQESQDAIHLLKRPVRDIADALGGNFEYFRHQAVSTNEKMIAFSTWDGYLAIYNREAGTVTKSIRIEFDHLNQIAFSPNNKHLATGGIRQLTTLWRIPNSQIVNSFRRILPGGNPFSPNSDLLTIASPVEYYMETVDVKTGKNITVMGEYPRGANVLFLREGNLLAASTINQTKVWDVPAKSELYQKSGRISACRFLSAQHDDEFLALFTKTSVFQNQNTATDWICSMLDRGEVNLATTNTDQSLLAFANSDGLLELWNAKTSDRIWRSPSYHEIRAIAISPDSRLVASGSTDASITVWDANNGQAIITLDGCYAGVEALQFSPDGKWLGSASSDGIVRLWGIVTR